MINIGTEEFQKVNWLQVDQRFQSWLATKFLKFLTTVADFTCMMGITILEKTK